MPIIIKKNFLNKISLNEIDCDRNEKLINNNI